MPGIRLHRFLRRLAACGAAALLGSAHAAPVEAIDDSGQTVRLAAPAARVVALGPFLTENLFAAGAGSQLVGVSRFSDWPAAAKQLPVIGDFYHLDVERIAQLKPALIVAWRSGFPPTLFDKLRTLHIPIYYSDPHSFADVATTLERLGTLTGHADDGRRAAERLRRDVAALDAQQFGKRPVAVFYQAWNQPLMTLNRDHFISDMLRHCGGVNVFAHAKLLVPTVSTEAVVAANPEVIITGTGGGEPDADFARWQAFPQLAAVKHRQLYRFDSSLLTRQTPRALEAAQQICAALDQARRLKP